MQKTVTVVDPKIMDLLENYGLEDYAGKRAEMKDMFRRSRTFSKTSPIRIGAERLIKLHENYCRKSQNDVRIRQHNTFALMYIYGHTPKEIARKLDVTQRSVYRDIGIVLDEMMIIIFGIDGLRQKPEPQKPTSI